MVTDGGFRLKWRCGTSGCGQCTFSPVLLTPRLRSSGGVDEGPAVVAYKRSRHGGGGGGEGVPARQL
jgi:hypothetical protein